MRGENTYWIADILREAVSHSDEEINDLLNSLHRLYDIRRRPPDLSQAWHSGEVARQWPEGRYTMTCEREECTDEDCTNCTVGILHEVFYAYYTDELGHVRRKRIH